VKCLERGIACRGVVLTVRSGMEKRADHVGTDVPIADHGNRRILFGAAGHGRAGTGRCRKQSRSDRGDPGTTHPAQLPDPTAEFTEKRGRERVRLCRNSRYCWGACHKGLRRQGCHPTNGGGGIYWDSRINACGRRFSSIPARPNLPFDAAAAFTTISLGANSAALPCDIASSGFPGAFRAAENLKTRG